jgi:hypothetical protein
MIPIIAPKSMKPTTTAVYVGLGLSAGLYLISPHDAYNFGVVLGDTVGVLTWAHFAAKRGRSQWCALWGWCGIVGLLGILFMKDKSKAKEDSNPLELIP